ncbi:MAG: hypothetical protein H6719_15560 [Sandaracinaceae bacterium]|nr:hypothetical protein [Sandaracinaceae bacterium]
MLEQTLTIDTVAFSLGAVAGWVAGLVALGVGAWRRSGRGRVQLVVAAAAQLLAAPLVVTVAWWRMEAFAQTFGAEGLSLTWLLQLAPATCLAAFAFAAIEWLVALAPDQGA